MGVTPPGGVTVWATPGGIPGRGIERGVIGPPPGMGGMGAGTGAGAAGMGAAAPGTEAMGTWIGFLQRGQRPILPANWSLTVIDWPQEQKKVIGTRDLGGLL
jgi:hypothetical protein